MRTHDNAATKTVTFTLEAGAPGSSGPFNFDTYTNGAATLVVPPQSKVVMNFTNHDGTPHSAEVMADQDPMPNAGGDPAIPGAYTKDLTQGLPQGGKDAQAVYRSEPLRELCAELFGDVTFNELRTPLVVSSVDVESSAPLWWGVPSLPDVPVADAVYASCAMPGLLPPGLVCGRVCIDGGVLDPLALRAVAPLADLVIAVVLDSTSPPARAPRTLSAAPTLWWHAQSIVTRDLGRHTLALGDGPPLLVIRPHLHDVHVLRGADPSRVIQAGYEAARRVLDRWDGFAVSAGGVHPTF